MQMLCPRCRLSSWECVFVWVCFSQLLNLAPFWLLLCFPERIITGSIFQFFCGIAVQTPDPLTESQSAALLTMLSAHLGTAKRVQQAEQEQTAGCAPEPLISFPWLGVRGLKPSVVQLNPAAEPHR